MRAATKVPREQWRVAHRFLNKDKGSQLRDDEDGYPSGTRNTAPEDGTNLYSYDHTVDGMQVHANKVLQLVENVQCCNCRKRWQLAILANIGFMIVFGIRCNFGAAKNHMFKNYTDPWGRKHMHEFNWTRAELSVMESSFFYGYLVTQIPAGFLAAKYPPNKLFGIAIGVASFLNILLPHGFNSKSDELVAVIQILQGLVQLRKVLIQGVAFPSMHGVWRYWAPPLERSKLATTAFTGSYAGAVLGLPVSAWLVSYVSWSAPFYLYGVAGTIWAVFWFALTFEKPAFHPTISQEEKKYIEDAIGHVSASHPTLRSIPWKAILTSKPVWAIIVANFARSWTFYLLLQNQLTYMKERLDMNISDSGVLAALPHAVMGLVVLLGGQLADYLRSHKILSTTAVRKLFNCGGFGGEALFMLVVAYTNKESTAVLALVLAVGCSGFAISGFNVNHLDIAPRYAAILMGFSNGIGTLAGLTCPIVTEKFTANGAHGWEKVFLLASLIHFTGVTFYAVYASGELQDWAEPKDEEEAWNVTALNNRSSNAGYGAAKNEMPITMTPLPTAEQLAKGHVTSATVHGQVPESATNPFTTAWDDATVQSNPSYQNW
ncbi:transporter, major facilitator family protein [Ancylostoma ceylanicum]|uniref:Transporter, major facilitator family protein n=1 Tax=Ancylostoma ceylanicum TaxID=53326 RepID=A0A0D6LCG4_9BILA|nr:transporter, major facilitator family protein [Ancylostoma ceylanicum]